MCDYCGSVCYIVSRVAGRRRALSVRGFLFVICATHIHSLTQSLNPRAHLSGERERERAREREREGEERVASTSLRHSHLGEALQVVKYFLSIHQNKNVILKYNKKSIIIFKVNSDFTHKYVDAY